MDIMPFPFEPIFSIAFLVLLAFVLFLNIFGLPANWLILGLVALWGVITPDKGEFTFLFWVLMIFLAVIGEVIEALMQIRHGRKYGSSSSGTVAGMIGAFAGAIFLAPLFWGLGALIGALLGAWIGCFLMELLRGRPTPEAIEAAFGAMLGRFLGTSAKMGIGALMIVLTARRIWPDLPDNMLEQQAVHINFMTLLQSCWQIST